MKYNEHLKVIGTCDGIGGMAMGCIQAGFNKKLSSDKWEAPKLIFEANRPELRPDLSPSHYCLSRGLYLAGPDGDLFHLTLSIVNDYLALNRKDKINVGELALLIAGTVCTFLTGINTTKRHPFGDLNYLMMRQIDMIKEMMPMVAVMEQVPGFEDEINQPFRNEFWDYCKRITLDYHIECVPMNSMFYGARQNRERLIFLFVRKDIGTPSFPEPQPVDPSQFVGNLLPHIKGFRNGKKFVRANDRLFTTMTSGNIDVRLFEGGIRPMTIEERKVLCNLEDLNTNVSGVTNDDLIKMMGNMVQIPFMAAIAEHIRTHILRA